MVMLISEATTLDGDSYYHVWKSGDLRHWFVIANYFLFPLYRVNRSYVSSLSLNFYISKMKMGTGTGIVNISYEMFFMDIL